MTNHDKVAEALEIKLELESIADVIIDGDPGANMRRSHRRQALADEYDALCLDMDEEKRVREAFKAKTIPRSIQRAELVEALQGEEETKLHGAIVYGFRHLNPPFCGVGRERALCADMWAETLTQIDRVGPLRVTDRDGNIFGTIGRQVAP